MANLSGPVSEFWGFSQDFVFSNRTRMLATVTRKLNRNSWKNTTPFCENFVTNSKSNFFRVSTEVAFDYCWRLYVVTQLLNLHCNLRYFYRSEEDQMPGGLKVLDIKEFYRLYVGVERLRWVVTRKTFKISKISGSFFSRKQAICHGKKSGKTSDF